jgi:hypothetical protein
VAFAVFMAALPAPPAAGFLAALDMVASLRRKWLAKLLLP